MTPEKLNQRRKVMKMFKCVSHQGEIPLHTYENVRNLKTADNAWLGREFMPSPAISMVAAVYGEGESCKASVRGKGVLKLLPRIPIVPITSSSGR